MNADAFRQYFEYHFTENRKIWDLYVASLSQEQFTRAVDYSYGSVRDQIVHLMSADEYWFSGLRGIPAEAEEVMVARDVALTRLTGGRLHVCHVSSRHTVELIRRAKQEGLPVTAEVTPHHLTLTHDAPASCLMTLNRCRMPYQCRLEFAETTPEDRR